MDIFLIGKGNVGTALSNFLQIRGINYEILEKVPEDKIGMIFLAVSDSAVKPLLEETLRKNPGIFAVHFSAATQFEDKRVFLLHPYSSINKGSKLDQILFTLWGTHDPDFEEMLKKAGFDFVYCGKNPDRLYHASAVISGNFTQFFAIHALKFLQSSGLSKDVAERLLRQLVNSSLDNIFRNGKNGLTGPAVRGEKELLFKEYSALSKEDPALAALFKTVNETISDSLPRS